MNGPRPDPRGIDDRPGQRRPGRLDHAQRVGARLITHSNNILTAINNRPDWEFLQASLADQSGPPRTHANLTTELNKIFMNQGDPLFLAPDGTPYRFDVHQWFNAISWD